MGRLCVAAAVCVQMLLTCDAVWAQDAQKRVLTLYSTRRDARIVDIGDRDLPRIIERDLGESIDYYSEFIDQARFAQPQYSRAVRDFLRVKYQAQSFDVLIAVGDASLRFVEEWRSELFPNTPLVYFSAEPGEEAPANATGIVSPLNLVDTLLLATHLQPETRQVFVITGSTAGNDRFEAAARSQFSRFAPLYQFTYLAGLESNELEARLAALPPHSIVYYLLVDRDGAAKNVRALDYIERIASIANAPVYCWVDSTIGTGVVGGSLKSQTAEMSAIAALALRVLNGEAAASIPAVAADLNVKQVDWRALERWGISESRVPGDTEVLFKNPSLWNRYKYYIIASLVALTAQTALIAGLLVQAARRRQAESGLIASQASLRASHDTILDLNGRLLQAQEEERSHVARELHDDVGQQITLLVTDLQKASAASRSNDREHALDVARDHALGLAKRVHDLSHRLHPANLRLLGLPAALDGLRNEWLAPGVDVSLSYDEMPDVLAPEVTLCVFRVIQEALQNAIKHGGATEILIHVGGGPDALTATIVDDGSGFEVRTAFGKGLGLISMNERVEAVGGSLTIRSAPNTGTRLKIQIPLTGAGAVQPAAAERSA